MFCRRAQWEGKNFPRELFALSKSKRGRVLMHSKVRSSIVNVTFSAAITSQMIIAILDVPDPQPEPSEASFVSETEESDDDEIVEVDRNGVPKGKSVPKEKGKETARPYGWAYVGSHNFTASAWGTLSGTGFTPILNVRCILRGIPINRERTWGHCLQITNYELGIVFPLQSEVELERAACFERPPPKYTGKDLPWVRVFTAYTITS